MFFDTAIPYQINLQDSATYGMEMIVQLHNYVMFINVFIISVVVWFFFEIIAITGFLRWFSYRVFIINFKKVCMSQLVYKQINNSMLHMSTLEIVWTLLPVLALITIALPSLSMLYYFSMSFSPAVIVNVIGHQWFWSYEYHYSSEITDYQMYNDVPLVDPNFEREFDELLNDFFNEVEVLEPFDPETFEAFLKIISLREDKIVDEVVDLAAYVLEEIIEPQIQAEPKGDFWLLSVLGKEQRLPAFFEAYAVLDSIELLNKYSIINMFPAVETFNELFNEYYMDLTFSCAYIYEDDLYELFGIDQIEPEINEFMGMDGREQSIAGFSIVHTLATELCPVSSPLQLLEELTVFCEDVYYILFDEMFHSLMIPNIKNPTLESDMGTISFNNDNIEKFDSIMTQVEDLTYGSFRLLEVDKPLYLPVDVPIRVIVSSDDVLHSWAVPSLGVKIDCVPGRLNVVEFRIARQGIFYGQCSEICGTQHGFMPICIVTMPRKLFYFI